VLKIFDNPHADVPLQVMDDSRREVLFFQSEIAKNLPGPVRAPRFYRVDERPDQIWLWMERIETRQPDQWTLDDYAFAAHQLGKWNGACLEIPVQPWMAGQHYLPWLSDVNPEEDLKFSFNQKYIISEVRSRYERLWSEREKFFSVFEALPQTFTHFDVHRRNLFICRGKNDEKELLLIDWAMCGRAAVGSDLFTLVGMSTALLEWSPSFLMQLERVAIENYLRGLHESGWQGDDDLVRLGYLTLMSLWIGCKMPVLFTFWCAPENNAFALQQFNHVEEELYMEWLPLFKYALDCADEARSLMKKLGYG
jgi:hypothetical protein